MIMNFIILNREEITLKDLGEVLIDSGIFYNGELNVIGFDGGISTRIYIKNHPEFSFRAETNFPAFIGVK